MKIVSFIRRAYLLALIDCAAAPDAARELAGLLAVPTFAGSLRAGTPSTA